MVHVKKKEEERCTKIFFLCGHCAESPKKRYHIDCFLCVTLGFFLFSFSLLHVRPFFLSFFLLDCLRTKDEESSFPPSFKNPTEKEKKKTAFSEWETEIWLAMSRPSDIWYSPLSCLRLAVSQSGREPASHICREKERKEGEGERSPFNSRRVLWRREECV